MRFQSTDLLENCAKTSGRSRLLTLMTRYRNSHGICTSSIVLFPLWRTAWRGHRQLRVKWCMVGQQRTGCELFPCWYLSLLSARFSYFGMKMLPWIYFCRKMWHKVENIDHKHGGCAAYFSIVYYVFLRVSVPHLLMSLMIYWLWNTLHMFRKQHSHDTIWHFTWYMTSETDSRELPSRWQCYPVLKTRLKIRKKIRVSFSNGRKHTSLTLIYLLYFKAEHIY